MNILGLSEIFSPSANKIFRWVSIRQGMPLSIREIVIGEILACLASSVLLIRRDSRTDLRLFLAIARQDTLKSRALCSVMNDWILCLSLILKNLKIMEINFNYA